MPDFLTDVAKSVWESVREGYYDVEECVERPPHPNLKATARKHALPIIAEIKRRSPSAGLLSEKADVGLAHAFEDAGASAISVIVERNHFDGSIELLRSVSHSVSIPVLFKDFVVSKKQVVAASLCGADIVLLIAELFRDHHTELPLEEMIRFAHLNGLEVLLEFHDPKLLDAAVSSEADYVGVNNRDLYTLKLDPDTFYRLSPHLKGARFRVAESGYSGCAHIMRDRLAGADAFLIGSSIMSSPDPPRKLKELLACGQG